MDDPALSRFALDVQAALKTVENRMSEALADEMDAAAAAIKLRSAVPVSDAAARERAKCAAIVRRYWWLPGAFIVGKLWDGK